MCYSNSSTSTNVQLAERYKRKIPDAVNESPVFCASGFTFPAWRIVTKDESIQVMNWGLIPQWFKGNDPLSIASKTLNAKLETLTEKASFRHLIERNRCIVPSTGFFEWQTKNNLKIPYFVYPKNDSVFSMAGLMDHWLTSDGKLKRTFTIITCPANELMSEIHNLKKRMPVILNQENEVDWLAGQLPLNALQTPFSSALMDAHEVNRSLINGKNHNQSDVQQPYSNGYFSQGTLF